MKFIKAAAFGITGIAFTASCACAEEASEGLSEIIVTAQKVSENINDVGMSINAMSGSDLDKIGISNPDQLTKAVPGLNVTRSGYGPPIYTMRGVGYYDLVAGAPSAVSLYLDETPLTYPIMSRGVAIDIQRIEVLKGPQGTLFGQNSTGGLVNFIANRPTDTPSAGVGASYGSYNRFNINGFVSGPLTETLKARLAVSTDGGGAWQRSATRDDHLGTARFSTARALLDWAPAERLNFRFNANGWIDKSDEQAAQIVALATTPSRITPALQNALNSYPPPNDSRSADWGAFPAGGFTDLFTGDTYRGYRRDDNFFQLSLRAEYELTDNVKLTSITAKNKLRQSSMIDVDGTAATIYDVTNKANIDAFSQELRVSGATGHLQWLIGGNYAHDNVDNFIGVYNTIGSQPFRNAGSAAYQRINTKAVFAHFDYAITDRLKVVSGIRYTDVSLFNVGCMIDSGDGLLFNAVKRSALQTFGATITSPAEGRCVTFIPAILQPGWVIARLDQHNVPFNIGLNWKIAEESLLYASINRGFKAGTFSPNGAVFATSLAPAVQEKVKAYEVGFKLALLDNHMQFNGAVFRYDYDNKQVKGKIVDPVLGSISKTINVPKSRINGAELQLMFVPNSHWHLNTGVTYVDSKVTDHFVTFTASGLTSKDIAGDRLPLTPRWQGQADIEFSTPVSAGLDGFIGAHGQYQGSTYGGVGQEAAFKIDSYATFDLRAGIRAADERWSASVFVNNVANKYSWNAANANGPDAITRVANPPRTFGVRGNVRF